MTPFEAFEFAEEARIKRQIEHEKWERVQLVASMASSIFSRGGAMDSASYRRGCVTAALSLLEETEKLLKEHASQ
jgi:hypothetical protein